MDLATALTLATLIITGPARVIDGDTVAVTDTFTSPSPIHVRLKGVDAAEMNTAIGRQSRQVMLQIVGRSDLTCYLTGEKTYRREVGYCFTSSDVDINQEIIARGAALGCARYDDRYTKYETTDAVAHQTRAGYCGAKTKTETKPKRHTSVALGPEADALVEQKRKEMLIETARWEAHVNQSTAYEPFAPPKPAPVVAPTLEDTISYWAMRVLLFLFVAIVLIFYRAYRVTYNEAAAQEPAAWHRPKHRARQFATGFAIGLLTHRCHRRRWY